MPLECIGFQSKYNRYYQITAIDLSSRKRVLKLVKEKSSYEPSEMVKNLEKDLGFKIKTVQTDNGREFCNDREEKKSIFEKTLEALEIDHIRTRPYSPWQNGLVERSHKMDNDLFYSKRRFSSEEEMYRAFQRYSSRTNNIARRILNFKTLNEMVQTYFMKEA
ncbi:DDE-type integrase/transposase/recombinase [Peptococcus simiae]|uniref:DDE-type integrase/transposase/recombinase n=1 Tax=Peptococcus simiae TaxID=1643805 RepID=UPI00397FBDF2